mmetsp:Transcript_67914/g.221081  ORF Transcript_67914/g.221081 Transcript_67914/m.221081 type:complete len:270 (-) Transcript_67914:860-1669(-)
MPLDTCPSRGHGGIRHEASQDLDRLFHGAIADLRRAVDHAIRQLQAVSQRQCSEGVHVGHPPCVEMLQHGFHYVWIFRQCDASFAALSKCALQHLCEHGALRGQNRTVHTDPSRRPGAGTGIDVEVRESAILPHSNSRIPCSVFAFSVLQDWVPKGMFGDKNTLETSRCEYHLTIGQRCATGKTITRPQKVCSEFLEGFAIGNNPHERMVVLRCKYNRAIWQQSCPCKFLDTFQVADALQRHVPRVTYHNGWVVRWNEKYPAVSQCQRT